MYGGLLIEKKSFIKDRVFAPLNLCTLYIEINYIAGYPWYF
jgi:hypothetical protein